MPSCRRVLLMNTDGTQYAGAHGVVVSHPLSMREALGSIPSVSMLASDVWSALLYAYRSGSVNMCIRGRVSCVPARCVVHGQ